MAMNYAKLVMSIGVWVAVLPLLGFPASWRQVLFGITGILLIIIGNSLKGKSSAIPIPKEHTENEKPVKIRSIVRKPAIVNEDKEEPDKYAPILVNPPQIENPVISEDFLSRISD